MERAVASVVAQTRWPHELILINDGSNDETGGMLDELQSRHGCDWVKVIHLPGNAGPSVARNLGWNRAKQPYVAFLDADDEWHPEKLRIQYEWMEARPNVVLTGRSAVEASESLEMPVEVAIPMQAHRISVRELLFRNRFSTPTVMIRRDLEYRFVPTKRRSEDYLLWLTLALSGAEIWHLDLPPTIYHRGPTGLSSDLWEMEKAELHTFWCLYSRGYVGPHYLAWLLPFSLAKFVRRIGAALLKPKR